MHYLLQIQNIGEISRPKGYFDFRFCVRQVPFNPGNLTRFSTLRLRDQEIFTFDTTLRLIKCLFKAGFLLIMTFSTSGHVNTVGLPYLLA